MSRFVTNPFGYAGQYTDTESGLIYLRARYYDPATGQFLNRDPIVDVTREAYAYVGGNPLNFTDPTGLRGASGSWTDPEEAERIREQAVDEFMTHLSESSDPCDAHEPGWVTFANSVADAVGGAARVATGAVLCASDALNVVSDVETMAAGAAATVAGAATADPVLGGVGLAVGGWGSYHYVQDWRALGQHCGFRSTL